MKTTFLSIVALLMSIQSFSQMNYPIPMDSTSEWRQGTAVYDPHTNYFRSSDYRVFISGDTTINNHVYSRLMCSGVSSFTYQGQTYSMSFENAFYALIRSDSVRTYEFMNGQDELLYDFSLQVGDTLPMTILNWCPTVIITSIDTVQVAGKNLKRFNISDPVTGDLNITWFMEGLGNENGLNAPINITLNGGSSFECYAENHVPVFPEESTCDLTVDIVERPLTNETILIYPNPSNGIFTVSLNAESDKDLHVTITGVSGNLIHFDTWQIKQGLNENTCNLSGTSAGIYVLVIQDGNSIIRRKVVLTE
jgi:hypothetical protein